MVFAPLNVHSNIFKYWVYIYLHERVNLKLEELFVYNTDWAGLCLSYM